MTEPQEHLRSLFNLLTRFSKRTVQSNYPKPIRVSYDKSNNLVLFNQFGDSIYTEIPLIYGWWNKLKKYTYLLPEDYDTVMRDINNVINSGELLNKSVLISPADFGFSVYTSEEKTGGLGFFQVTSPQLVLSVKLVSDTTEEFVKQVEEEYDLDND